MRTDERDMTIADLLRLDESELANFLWRRLRGEAGAGPDLGHRFGDEEPETLVLTAARSSEAGQFRAMLSRAVEGNLRRMADERAASGWRLDEDRTGDEQLASLAYIASELEARELVELLYGIACRWFLPPIAPGMRPTLGPSNLLRTVAQLQQPGVLEHFWRSLWENGPRSFRGLVIFGWARADVDAALARLPELVADRDLVDFEGALWSLTDSQWGPGLIALAMAAAKCSVEDRSIMRDALARAGLEERGLQEFDLHSGVVVPGGEPGPQLFTVEARLAPVHHPHWPGREAA